MIIIPVMPLSAGWNALALKLQEASVGLTHGNVRDRLSDAVNDLHQGTDSYGHYIDHDGDGETGNCVYYSGGDTCSAPYTVGDVNGKKHASIDHESRVKVIPQITYHAKAEDDDHYTAMEAAGLYVPGSAHLVERFISKGERDKADPGDFAGKGKSFPILKPGDVSAAVHAMGRAGGKNYGMSGLKSRIKDIAKKKGWTSHLPKAWQDEADECGMAAAARETDLLGDLVPLREGAVGQDGSAYLKLISPGRGSSGYYPAEVLERDGPKVFPKGTKNFWNHQTDAEEAARPEGDLRDLASVLTEDAHYEHEGPAGPGLYARAEVQPHYRGPVDSLAKHIGMSIRASGKAKEGTGPDGKRGPIIEELTRGISIDYVTSPGAGGKILQLFEAAGRQIQLQEGDVDATELKRLQESNRKLSQRLARNDARDVAEAKLRPISLPTETKLAIIERAVPNAPITADGDFDAKAFATLLEAEIQYAASLIPGGARIVGMGTVDPKLTEADRQAQHTADAAEFDSVMNDLAGFVMGEAGDGASKKDRKKFNRLHEAFRQGRAAA